MIIGSVTMTGTFYSLVMFRILKNMMHSSWTYITYFFNLEDFKFQIFNELKLNLYDNLKKGIFNLLLFYYFKPQLSLQL